MFTLQMLNHMGRLQREAGSLFDMMNSNRMQTDHDYEELRMEKAEDGYRLSLALSGMDPKQLKIDILGRRISISAEPEATREQPVTWHRRERSRRSFSRSLVLPDDINVDRVEADYHNGVLTIFLPEAEAARPKRISVKAL